MRVPQRIAAALLAGALSLSLSGAVLAQQRGRNRGMGTIAVAILRKLNLSAEQDAKIKAATEAFRAEGEKNAALTTPQEKRQAGRKARETYLASVKEVLNADQQKQLEALQAEAREFSALGPAASAQMAGLNLTVEQKTKVKEIGAKYQPELEKLRASQKDSADKQAVQAQIRDTQKKMLDEIKTVLTPEQAKLLTPARGQNNQ